MSKYGGEKVSTGKKRNFVQGCELMDTVKTIRNNKCKR